MSEGASTQETQKVVHCKKADGFFTVYWILTKNLLNSDKFTDEIIQKLADQNLSDNVKIGFIHWLSARQLILLEKKLQLLQNKNDESFKRIQKLFNKQIVGAHDSFWELVTFVREITQVTSAGDLAKMLKGDSDSPEAHLADPEVQVKEEKSALKEEITSFNLSGSKLSADDLRNLKKISPNIEHLSFEMCDLDDSAIEILKDFKKLQSLNLTGNRISDEGLKTLSEFEALTELRLDHTSITGDGLQHFQKRNNLTILSLKACQYLTDEGFETLQYFTNLLSLNLSRTRFSDTHFHLLKSLGNLTYLNISGCLVNGSGLTELNGNGGLQKLEILDFSSCFLTEQAALEIKKLSHLKHLILQFCDISDELLKDFIESLKALEFLDLAWNYHLTDKCLFSIGTLPNLKGLNLTGCKEIRDSGLTTISTMRSLQKLDIYGCTISNTGLDELSLMPALSHLTILAQPKGIDANGIARLKNCQNITHLTIGLEESDPIFLNKIVKSLLNLSNLEVLELQGSLIKGGDATPLAALKTLQKLIFTNTPKEIFSPDSIKKLQEKLPNLHPIWQRKDISH